VRQIIVVHGQEVRNDHVVAAVGLEEPLFRVPMRSRLGKSEVPSKRLGGGIRSRVSSNFAVATSLLRDHSLTRQNRTGRHQTSNYLLQCEQDGERRQEPPTLANVTCMTKKSNLYFRRNAVEDFPDFECY
jgi:hypothetical protein